MLFELKNQKHVCLMKNSVNDEFSKQKLSIFSVCILSI